MNITVIVCTCNRFQELAVALESMAASRLPEPIKWEVLVVDNNSIDQTREVVEGFSRRYSGRFRYLFEPRPGKSYALNSGVSEAHSDVLAFADDDATVAPNWLHNLTAPLLAREYAGSAGRIILEWPSELPNWLAVDGPHARHPFPGFDQGPEAKDLEGPPFGANMAFQSFVFDKYGLFRTDLGPSPNPEIPRPGEDVEFGRRLIAGGERLRYEPSAVVYHPVVEKRINKPYFLEWRFDLGRANYRMFGIRPGTKWFAGGIPLYLFRGLVAWTLRWIVTLDPSQRFSNRLIVWEKAGEIAECYRQSHAAKKSRECNAEA